MRFILSALVTFIFGGTGQEREASVNWTVDHPPTKQEMEKKVDDFVKGMILAGDTDERLKAAKIDTYAFEITSIFRES